MMTWHRTQYGMKNSLWKRVQTLKKAWMDEHPDATPIEIEVAGKEILRELGL